MKHRILAILLVLCLCVSLVPAARAADTRSLAASIDIDQLVDHGISMFKALEAGGKWDSVANMYNIGCVGMGIMGWINSSALQLLKWCASSAKGGDPDYTRSILGESLYNEVVSAPVAIASELMPRWGYWGTRLFTAQELAAAKALLGSPLGIRVQKNLARLYLTKEAQRGWNAGVRTEAGLLYYCSADNHYGEGGVKNFMTKVRNALGLSSTDLITSLRQFHQGAVLANVDTLSYRTKVYNYLVNTLHLDQDGDEPIPEPTPEPTPAPDPVPTVPFKDMPAEDHWAYDAIVWAYHATPRITSGTSSTTFSPNSNVTRAEAMTFLWTAAGRPAPSSTQTKFKDLKVNSYYYKAVLWAVENGYTSGRTPTTFAPKGNVTRAELLTFLWAYVKKPTQSWWNLPFTDVIRGKYYYHSVAWAYYGGILVGTENDGNSFHPDKLCTRAYVVTYLYNLFVMTAP